MNYNLRNFSFFFSDLIYQGLSFCFQIQQYCKQGSAKSLFSGPGPGLVPVKNFQSRSGSRLKFLVVTGQRAAGPFFLDPNQACTEPKFPGLGYSRDQNTRLSQPLTLAYVRHASSRERSSPRFPVCSRARCMPNTDPHLSSPGPDSGLNSMSGKSCVIVEK